MADWSGYQLPVRISRANIAYFVRCLERWTNGRGREVTRGESNDE